MIKRLYDLRLLVSHILIVFMSHSLLWKRIVLLKACVYSSNYEVLYIIGIGITRRLYKGVGLSFHLQLL